VFIITTKNLTYSSDFQKEIENLEYWVKFKKLNTLSRAQGNSYDFQTEYVSGTKYFFWRINLNWTSSINSMNCCSMLSKCKYSDYFRGCK